MIHFTRRVPLSQENWPFRFMTEQTVILHVGNPPAVTAKCRRLLPHPHACTATELKTIRKGNQPGRSAPRRVHTLPRHRLSALEGIDQVGDPAHQVLTDWMT